MNINETTKEGKLYEDREGLDGDRENELNKILDKKEDELENMKIRFIWYSASIKDESDGHESAKRQLLKFILGDTRDRFEKQRQKKNTRSSEKKLKKRNCWMNLHSFQKNMMKNSLGIVKNDSGNVLLPEEQLNEIKQFFQVDIHIKESFPGKYEITFPAYRISGGLYDISLISENDSFYLSDNSAICTELNKVFELKEPDVLKNLLATLRRHECHKQPNTNAFTIEGTLEDIHVKMSCLIQTISFMLNMRIFYV